MFTPEERTRIRDRVFEIARADKRVTGGAVTGSGALGTEDRYSDIDTSFGIDDGADPEAVLDDWTRALQDETGIIHYWDLHRDDTIYRVYLLPGGLELDIAMTPARAFGKKGPKFKLLFGEGAEHPAAPAANFDELAGWGWIYAFSARTAIERGRLWAAESWIGSVRHQTIALACLRHGLPTAFARGYHDLPQEILKPYELTLVRSLDPPELTRALAEATTLLLAEIEAVAPALANNLRPALSDVLGMT